MVSMATRYMILKNEGSPSKTIISRVLIILAHLTWYKIKALTQAFPHMVLYVNNLICIFMNINENLKNEVKTIKNTRNKQISGQNYHQTAIVASFDIISDTI